MFIEAGMQIYTVLVRLAPRVHLPFGVFGRARTQLIQSDY